MNDKKPNAWTKSLLIWVGVLFGLVLFVQMLDGGKASATGAPIAYSDFVRQVDAGNVRAVTMATSAQGSGAVISGKLANGEQFRTIAPNDANVSDRLIGKGVAVHSNNCPNVTNLLYEPERRIDVQWASSDKEGQPISYPVKLTLFCDDRFGMLKQITSVISDQNTNIRNIEARTSNGQASIDVVLEIADLKHLQTIINGVRQIPGVHDVQRLQKI